MSASGSPARARRAASGAPGASRPARVVVGGVVVTHPDKVWWPDEGLTKLDVVRYYDGVAGRLRPWMVHRPLAAERCPDGMRGACFFQKDFAPGRAAGLPTVPLRAASTGRVVHYVVGGARRTLLTLVNLGCIPIHLMNCRVDAPEQPDWLAFDLDPASGRFADAARAALLLRELLEELGLAGYPKTSGGKGLHVLVPLRRGPRQAEVRAVARAVGRAMVERAPELVTLALARRARGGRVFVDTLRNAFGQTLVAPYAVRRRPKAPVSTPLAWDEVDPRLDPSAFNVRTAPRRFAGPDPWADFWKRRQRLPALPA